VYDDSVAGAQLQSPLSMGWSNGGVEHRDCSARVDDLEVMQVGHCGAGAIGSAVLRRLKPRGGVHYNRPPPGCAAEVEEELWVDLPPGRAIARRGCECGDESTRRCIRNGESVRRGADLEDERGAYLINTARGRSGDRDAVARACVRRPAAWLCRADSVVPSPATAADHPCARCRTMAMTPHTSAQPFQRKRATPRVLARSSSAGSREADPRRIPLEKNFRRRRAGRRRRALLQRGRAPAARGGF